MSDSTGDARCPVCAQTPFREAKEAEGLVVAGVEAMLSADADQVQHVFDQLGPLEAHCAISLYTMLLLDMCQMFGQDPEKIVARHRQMVNEALSRQ